MNRTRPPLVAGLPDGERQDGDADVGVQALVVGVAMVKVVLGDPPAEAHPDPQVGVDQAGQVVAAPGTEDLRWPASWPTNASWVKTTAR